MILDIFKYISKCSIVFDCRYDIEGLLLILVNDKIFNILKKIEKSVFHKSVIILIAWRIYNVLNSLISI